MVNPNKSTGNQICGYVNMFFFFWKKVRCKYWERERRKEEVGIGVNASLLYPPTPS